MNNPIVCAENLHKQFDDGGLFVEVLNGVNLQVFSGESVAILGSSGSGKSTLLHLLGGLDTATSGLVRVAGQDLSTLTETKLDALRNKELGFVYQFHHLLPEFSALENVAMPLLIAGVDHDTALKRASHGLEEVGLGGRSEHRPAELSGGERQRAAIARALISEPKCVLADEPTGNLDSANASRALDAMLSLRASVGSALVVVTHDESLAQRLDRTICLADGKIVSE